MVGFYVLAIAIVALLLFIPYAQLVKTGNFHVYIAAICMAGAAMILWSILPRIDFFEHPGPLLDDREHPALFKCIRRVADRTRQSMPGEIFLLPNLNAWVSSRGGVMGFGSRRVLGVGLPLMQVISVNEFEAILAHEFGHHHGGDTRLGPWIYKTRFAIERTLNNLGDDGWSGILSLPFRWFGGHFMRVSQAISRAQEYTADRLAGEVAGARALIEGLKKIHAYAPAHNAYWQHYLTPVLSAEFRVPMASGFDSFLAAPPVQEAIKEEIGRSLENEVADPYDSHPTLRDRIEAVQDLIGTEAADSSPPAFELLEDIGAVEQAFFDYFSISVGGATFRTLEWLEVPGKVLLPIWQKQAGYAPLGTTTFAELPDFIQKNGQELARKVLGLHDESIPDEHLPGLLGPIIGSPIAAGLVREGFTLSAALGEAVVLTRDDISIEPFAVAGSLLSGGAQWEADWGAAVASASIGDCIIAEFKFLCPSCETAYDPEDYVPNSPEWHCSQCGEILPRE
jgi:Zn-dependent protease with chaperone function